MKLYGCFRALNVVVSAAMVFSLVGATPMGVVTAAAAGLTPWATTVLAAEPTDIASQAEWAPIVQDFTCASSVYPGWTISGNATFTGTQTTNCTNGWLRLTTNAGGQAGSAIYNTPIPSDQGFLATFQYADYGGSGRADGFSFYLIDGSTATPTVGAAGGALGYARSGTAPNNNTYPGVTNGYVGIGFDEYGNYTSTNVGNGGPGAQSQQVALRGSGNLLTGFNYLTRTVLSSPPFSQNVDQVLPTNPRWVRIYVITPTITVQMDFGSGWQTVINNYDLRTATGQVALPATFKLGFSGSTGGYTNYHLIRNLTVAKPVGLTVAETASRSTATKGDTVVFTTTVTNDNTNHLAGAVITAPYPSTLSNVTWTCAISGTGACGAASGTGALNSTLNLSRTASATYVFTGTVLGVSGTLTHTTIIAPPSAYVNVGTGAASAAVSLYGEWAPVNESFQCQSPTDPNWLLQGTAILTGTQTTNCSDGWLQLTNNTGGQAGSAIYNAPIPSNQGFLATFQYADFGGTNRADGFSFYLIDGSTVAPTVGAAGGALGYARSGTAPNNNTYPGVTNGYVGIGFDEYGNYTSTNVGNGGPGAQSQQVALRGSGNLLTGFNYLTRTVLSSSPFFKTVDQVTPASPRWARIFVINQKITVQMDFGSGWQTVISSYDLSTAAGQAALPATFKLGFSGSTGGFTNYHLIRNLTVAKPVGLTVTETASRAAATKGDTVVFTATVSNDSTNDLSGAVITAPYPSTLGNVTWTCTITGLGACGQVSGSGVLSSTLSLSRTASAIYVFTGTVLGVAGTLTHATTVAPPSAYVNVGNNAASAAISLSGEWAPVSESFQCGATADPNWLFLGVARLTGDSGCTGWLELTPNSGAKAGTAIYNAPIPSSQGFLATFQYADFGGTGADGFSFYLIDGATVSPTVGYPGGSLGYSLSASSGNSGPGVTNGFVGIGFDEYGNFTDGAINPGGSPPGRQPQQIALRGAGSLLSGFNYLTSTVLSPAHTVDGVPNTSPRWARVFVVNQRITVQMDFGSGWQTVVNSYDLSAQTLPSSLKFGFSGSTGGATNYHWIRNLTVAKPASLTLTNTDGRTTIDAGSTNVYTVTLANGTENDVTGITLTDTAPSALAGVTWTCASTGGGSTCGTASGSGNAISLTVNLPKSSSVQLLITGLVTATTASPQLTNPALITLPAGYVNVGPGNSATDTTAVRLATSVGLAAAPLSLVYGQTLYLTGTASTTSPSVIPAGSLTFKEGSTTLGSGALNGSGVAILSIATLSVGTHNITATYGGDAQALAGTSNSVSANVAKASTTTSLAGSPASFVVGQTVYLTATVSVVSPGAGTRTGTVTFKDGTTTLGTGSVNGAGVATYNTAALAAGPHSVTAVYGGDGYFQGSTSNVVNLTAYQPPAVAAVSTVSGLYGIGQTLTLTVTWTHPAYIAGSPLLPITMGTGQVVSATYVSGSGTTTTLFRYVVQEGDTSPGPGPTSITLGSGLALNGGQITGALGEAADPTLHGVSVAGVAVDGVRPTVSALDGPSGGPYSVGASLPFTLTWSEPVTLTGSTHFTFTISDGGTTVTRTAVYSSGTGTGAFVFAYTVQAGDNGNVTSINDVLQLTGGDTLQDAALNDANRTLNNYTGSGSLLDTTPPSILSVKAPESGYYRAGTVLQMVLNWSEAVTVTGSPSVTLLVGSTLVEAQLVSGSGTAALGFEYVVQPGENGVVTIGSLSLSPGDAIQDKAFNNAGLTFSAPDTSGVIVDTAAPQVSWMRLDADPTNAGSVQFSVVFTETAVGVNAGQVVPDHTGLSGASVASVLGTGAIFTVTLGGYGGTGALGLSIPATTTITDLAGNPLDVLPLTAETYTVDTVAPTVVSVTVPANGIYRGGELMEFVVYWSEPVSVTGLPKLTLLIGSTIVSATYAAGSETNALLFQYTVAAGLRDLDGVGIVAVALDGGTIKDVVNPSVAALNNDANLTLNGVADASQVLVQTTYFVYLPVLMRNFVHAPDLIVQSLVVSRTSVQVVILNQGTAPVTTDFWADLYVQPSRAPTGVNQVWWTLASQGIVWAIPAATTPLQAGQAITLTYNDAYYSAGESQIVWPLPLGVRVYAQVDSVNAATSYGAVLETHEVAGQPYNNISSTTVVP